MIFFLILARFSKFSKNTTKLGEKNLYKNPINNIDLDEWAYIHWLMDNDQSTLLKKLINYIDDLNQIWEPAITGKTSKDNTIGYYLHTQFNFLHIFQHSHTFEKDYSKLRLK